MDNEKKSIVPKDKDQTESLSAETLEEVENSSEFGSTIFTKAVTKEKKKAISPKKKAIITITALLLAVALIITSIYCVSKFVGNDENTDSNEEVLIVASVAHSKVARIEVKNQNGDFTILPKTVTEDGKEALKWYLKDNPHPLISDTMVGTVVDSCLYIHAVREMKDKTLDYGFDNPFATVKVITKDRKEDFTAILGSATPDKTGYYVKTEGGERVYLITMGTAGYINFTPEDLADNIMLDPVKLTDETVKADKKYFDSEGAIESFDYIELSGAKYGGEVIKITPAAESDAAKYIIKTQNTKRFANTETCEKVFGILKNGLVAVDVYKLGPTAEDIQKYGLQNPDYTVKIKYGTSTLELKATLYDKDNNYYAVQLSGKDAIYAMSGDALDMLGFSETVFYNEYVFLEYYNAYSKIVINTEKGDYVFDTEYNENADSNEFTVFINGQKVDEDLFTAYYQHIVSLAPKAETTYVKGEPSYKAVFTFADKSKGTKTLTLTKQSDRRYLVAVDGVDMGIVTSRIYDNLTDYIEYIINGKDIPDPQ